MIGLFFLSPCVVPDQTAAAVVPWDTLRGAALSLRQDLEGGNSVPAQMRVIQMQLLLPGPSPTSAEGQKIAKMGDQITQMESRPIPMDIDSSLSRFVPTADKPRRRFGICKFLSRGFVQRYRGRAGTVVAGVQSKGDR